MHSWNWHTRLSIFGIDSNFSIGDDICDLIIRSKFEVIIIFDGKFLILLYLFFIDKFLSDEMFEFFDGVCLEYKFVFVFELVRSRIEYDEVGFGRFVVHY